VLPGCWHHVTQRGNHRQTVFFDDSQRQFYLHLLHGHCKRDGVALGGYCLMGNHVHILAIPSTEASLSYALGRTHNDYARWLHLRRDEAGHLWQNRFYSCPLDDAGRWEALRYVELNPVRAGFVRYAADWPWSSAEAHLLGRDPRNLLAWDEWRECWSADRWNEALRAGIADAELMERIRQSTVAGRPLGSHGFVHNAEARLGRRLARAKPGPKPQVVVRSVLLRSQIPFANFEVM